jgi:hypothetical protein
VPRRKREEETTKRDEEERARLEKEAQDAKDKRWATPS